MSTKILVVEDEVIVAEDITKTLSDLGYVVTSVVKSGRQAIERAKTECPDLVLMDIVLKGKLDGVQVADTIRKKYKIPVVYLTAHADIATLERAKATEPFGYLLKPFGDRELQSTIEMALHKSQMEHRIDHLNSVLRALRNIDQLIVREKSTKKLLQGTCESLVESLSYYTACIMLVDQSGNLVEYRQAGIRASSLSEEEIVKQNHIPSCVREAMKTPEVVVIEDTSACENCTLMKNSQHYRALACRLDSDEITHGVLLATLPRDVPTDEEEVSLFKEIAEDISYALHKISLQKERERAVVETKRRNRELAAINAIAVAVNQLFNLHDILDTSLRETASILNVEGGVVYLYDTKKETFYPSVHFGISKKILKEVREFKKGEGLSGHVANTKKPLIIKDLSKNKQNISPSAIKEGWCSYMSAPIISGGGVSAILTLLSQSKNYFTSSHMNLILHICNQIGVAISNAHLYEGMQQELRDRIRAEEELKREKDFSESILETANALIVGLDKEGKIIYFNKAAERITGYTGGEVRLKDWFSLFVPSYARNDVYRYMTGEMQELPIHNGNYIQTKSGEKRWILWNNTLLKDIDGNISGIIGIGEDMTEARRTQQMIETLNKISQNVQKISAQEEIISILGGELIKFGLDILIARVNEKNNTLDIMYSSSPETLDTMLELIGFDVQNRRVPLTDFREIIHIIEEKRGAYIHDIESYLTLQLKGKEAIIQDISSKLSWRKMIIVPLLIRNEAWGVLFLGSNLLSQTDLPAFTAFAQQASAALENTQLYEKLRQVNADLSDLTQTLEQKVQERTEELMRANQLKSDFLANMSHEFRTPLNSIMSFADILLMQLEGPINRQQKEDLELIKESGKDLLILVNNILDLSKIETGKLELHMEPVDSEDIVSAVTSQLTLEAIENGLTMHTQISGPLPRVMGDEIRLKQVLRNLVANALKFTRKGGIIVGAYAEGDAVTFWIKDTGIGISSQNQSIIFDKFRQVQGGNSREFGGTGLGLTLTKELVELHGGRIWLESEEGKGSTFYFSIPIVK
ncbi:MAG: GAF domain-containing protein [Theionarchaea archaeon]|nr:GAF domain-containing protein [Theionarchaea archaeon]